MTIVNNFRYGKISRKMAGRFDAEQFNQGAFTYRNCRSLFDGGVTRRFPLRHLSNVSEKIISYEYTKDGKTIESIDVPASGTTYSTLESTVTMHVLKGFTIGTSLSFLLGFGTRDYERVETSVTAEAVLVAYAFEAGGFTVKAIKSLHDVVFKETTNVADPTLTTKTYVTLSEYECRRMNFAQYYDRMYVASHSFRTFFIDYASGGFEVANPQFIFNDDAKLKIGTVKSTYSGADKADVIGRTVIEYNGDYYFSTDYSEDNKSSVTAVDVDPADATRIMGFNDFEDNSFNTLDGSYPSIVAVINDSLWFANTTSKPNSIWKSRVLGSSQWLEGLSADTMHDFTQFQVVATEATTLLDSEEWPYAVQRGSDGEVMYHQEAGNDKWYSPRNRADKAYAYDLTRTSKNIRYKANSPHTEENIECYLNSMEEPYYMYDDAHRLKREAKLYIKEGYGYRFNFTVAEIDGATLTGSGYTLPADKDNPVTTSKGYTITKLDSGKYQISGVYLWDKSSDGPSQRRYVRKKDNSNAADPDNAETIAGVDEDTWYTPKGAVIKDKYTKLSHNQYFATVDDYDWTWASDNSVYSISTYGTPVREAYEVYDLSNTSTLYKMNTTIDMVATDSCSARFELNTGKLDAIRGIEAGCDKIIVFTSNAEWTLPSSFNAVSNMNASRYSSYGALEVNPIPLNRSILFLQRGKLIREFYLYESYLMQREASGFNHDIVHGDVIDVVSKNAPDPTFYLVMDDGSLVHGMYDVDAGLNSFADWDLNYGEEGKKYKFASVSSLEDNGEEKVVTLVSCYENNELVSQNICLFDEYEEESFHDEVEDGSSHTILMQLETSYIEVSNQNLLFGRNKKTKGVWLRPFKSGRVRIGNDERQLTITNYPLESEDYYAPVTGKSGLRFSMFVESYQNEPLTILAFAWEVES